MAQGARSRSMTAKAREGAPRDLHSVEQHGLSQGPTARGPIGAALVSEEAAGGPTFGMHSGLEFGVVLSGRVVRHCRAWRGELERGQVWFCNLWERHGWAVPAGRGRYLALVVAPSLLLSRFPEAPHMDWTAPFAAPPESRPQARGEQRSRILRNFSRLEHALTAEAPYRETALRLFLFESLLVLLESWSPPRQTRRAVRSELYEAVDRGAQLAAASPRGLTARAVAQSCGLNARDFGRLFRELTGTTFREFAARARLSRAGEEEATAGRSTGAVVGSGRGSTRSSGGSGGADGFRP
jgi:hypothetical protein